MADITGEDYLNPTSDAEAAAQPVWTPGVEQTMVCDANLPLQVQGTVIGTRTLCDVAGGGYRLTSMDFLNVGGGDEPNAFVVRLLAPMDDINRFKKSVPGYDSSHIYGFVEGDDPEVPAAVDEVVAFRYTAVEDLMGALLTHEFITPKNYNGIIDQFGLNMQKLEDLEPSAANRVAEPAPGAGAKFSM